MSDQADASDPAPAAPKVVPSVPPHPDVAVALALGWHVAELYHFERIAGEVEHGGPEGLPGIGGLSRADRADLLVSQIVAALERLGHQTREWEAMRQQVASPPMDVAALQHGVGDAHRALLKMLTARDAPMGKAYGLGRALAETTLIPTTQEPKSFVEQFDPYRVQTLQAQLADLRAALPKYAAEVVGRTLDVWVTWTVAGKLGSVDVQWPAAQKRQVAQSLRRQGEIWYGLLTSSWTRCICSAGRTTSPPPSRSWPGSGSWHGGSSPRARSAGFSGRRSCSCLPSSSSSSFPGIWPPSRGPWCYYSAR